MTSTAIVFPQFLYQIDDERFISAKPPYPLSTWVCTDCKLGVYESTGKPFITEPCEFHLDPWTGFWEMIDD